MKKAKIVVFGNKEAYFPLAVAKRKEFDLCKPYIRKFVREIRGAIYIRFHWTFVVLFASRSQIVEFDRIRKSYVRGLLDRHCKSKLQCYSKFIGSDTPKSDIDINFFGLSIEKAIHDMIEDHSKTFKDPLDAMFDTNLYGSVFRYFMKSCTRSTKVAGECYPKHISTYNQRIWSFIRLAQTLHNESSASRNNVLAILSKPYKRLFDRATKLLHKLQHKKDRQHWYHVYLTAYMKSLKENKDPRTISEAFSMCKFFENDAYYTVGAVLHIVEQTDDIEASSLFDSIYDNMGFAVEVMFAYGTCHSTLNIIKVSKMCKYIARICDAHKKLTGSSSLDRLYALSEKINMMRKQSSIHQSRLRLHVDKLYNALGIQSDDPEDIVIGVIRFVLNNIPRDPLLT